ncbi:hypothetical protein [Patulibacter americanus]|uniref:hypothetical protein n=1 Tax=Patulibacter americanus TaxID=588672 RepID=UPI0003B74D42|nr:hypothetical protein [Patulibacter americanus]
MRPPRATGAVLVLAAAGLTWPCSAGAVPPGGVADTPGTPAGSIEIVNPAGLREGKVQFCVRGFVTKSGTAPQQFMVKFDDHGSKGIGPFQPDATGTYCGEVATDRAAYASAMSADDKIPAGLCQGGQHWLRILSGSWSHPDASERSLAKDYTSDATCGTGGKAAAPTAGSVIGGDAGIGTAPAPPAGGPGGAGSPTPGGGSGAGGAGAGSGPGTAAPSLSGQATLRSRTARVSGSTVTLALRRTGAVGRGTITARSASRLRLTPKGARSVRTLVAARPYTLGGATTQNVRVRLTATGKRLLRTRSRMTVRVTLTPSGGTASTTTVVLLAAKPRK